MSKGNTHDDFDFGNDSEFQEKFYKNIDRVLYEPTEDNIEDNTDSETEAITENNAVSETEAITEDIADSEKEAITEDNADSEKEAITEDNSDTEIVATREDNEDPELMASTEEIDASNEASDEVAAAAAAQMDSAEALDETLFDINNSLAKQIGEELENLEAGALRSKKRSRMMKIQIGVIVGLLSLLSIAFFLGFTKPGNQLLIKMGINIIGKIWDAGTQDFTNEPDVIEDEDHLDQEDIASDSEEVDPDTIVWPENTGYGRREEGVYNILLLGEEAIDSGTARGRTDLIIIATLNKNSKTIKLTSLMRDTLVQIPGYKENKLNSAYEKGDVRLLYETISLNFNIHLDGGVLVNFENFEKIIDYMGGLEITLTNSEAKYLRNTNYISNPNYRNVVQGTQLMNGNQVLGYSRIRKRAAITGANNDYGRTDRHRIILNAIFEKYKTKNEIELASVMFKMLPMVKTDIDSKTFEKLLNTFIEMRTMEIDQLRIPADGTFTDNVKVRGMDVLIPDLSKNVSLLHDFIFGN
ncbi:MAG: hypothetical protein EWM47_08470 [Anaerolineaceae bacterium]|nr:MAG: hypothetical protein EWM47_08470 [Anaerolineaceae bacterium]